MEISFANLFINLSSIAILISVIIFSIKNRKRQGALQLVYLLSFLVIWAIGSFLEIGAINFETKVFWRNITQIGVFMAPVASIAFVFAYSGDRNGFSKKVILTLALIQWTAILLILTDSYHHLMRSGIEIRMNSIDSALYVKQTLLGKVMVSLNYIIMIVAEVKLAFFMRRTSKSYKTQVFFVMLGIVLPVIFGILKAAWLEEMGIIMPISALFTPGCLCLLWGVFKYDLFSISPIARDKVFDVVDEGIVVCSPEGTVVDINPSACKFFRQHELNTCLEDEVYKLDKTKKLWTKRSKEKAKELLEQKYEKWHKAIQEMRSDNFEITVTLDGEEYYYYITVHTLNTIKHSEVGTISMIRDITTEKRKNKILKIKAERDGLTKVFNKVSFVENVNIWLSNVKKDDAGIFMLVLDIDYFKKINDDNGHIAGDYVLETMVELINKCIREGDMIGRLGGEEFGVFLRNCKKKTAVEIAERIRKNIEKYEFIYKGKIINATVSIGISETVDEDLSFEQLFLKADTALYKAKQNGRNRVVISWLEKIN
ncbi:diguanylate cyclase [Abyssisolibacter fermentans]|uniref:histidine kinase N-terminal 7TM domain-containing diguanylate cyclase n=1 Tax=Abyssisolibacter fermentans TaxID=1766203 RepID=UPI0008346777|nr:diguanylate cyclase [Abyssisolibacter fermentans]